MRELLGILVNDGLIEGIRKNDTGYERLDFYEEAANRYDLVPCYFRLKDISHSSNTVNACIQHRGRWIRRRLPIPRVIHNRAIFQSEYHFKRCQLLAHKKITLFNFWNRYGKLTISRLLAENTDFLPYLPVTLPFSKRDLSNIAQRFPSFIVKPNKGTVGEGIIKVDRSEEGSWELKYRSGNGLVNEVVKEGNLLVQLTKLAGTEHYLLQETIDLATFRGSPFDIRVSVQKDGEGAWGITGMVGKAARAGHFLCNVAQGGSVHALPDLLKEYPKLQRWKVYEELSHVALGIAEYLEARLPNLADVGFDFGINREGHPFFIEMNGRDQRYSFAKGNMLDVWKQTYEKPMAYGRHLLDKMKERGR